MKSELVMFCQPSTVTALCLKKPLQPLILSGLQEKTVGTLCERVKVFKYLALPNCEQQVRSVDFSWMRKGCSNGPIRR